MKSRSSRLVAVAFVAVAWLPSGCEIQFPQILPGAPFVVEGTFELRSVLGGRDCPVWVDESGLAYHLFQNQNVDNAEFDAVTTPGTSSRLLLVERSDISVGCRMGPTAQVEEILEIR